MSTLGGPDEPTQQAPQTHDPGWYTQDVHAAGAHPVAPQPTRAPAQHRWLIPVLLVACGIAAFAVVTLLMHRGHDDAHPAAVSTSVTPQPATQATTPSSNSQATSSGPSTPPSSSAPSSASDVTRAFPAGVGATCGGGTGHEGDRSEPLPADVRVSADDGYVPGCDFVEGVHAWVNSELAAAPSNHHFERDDTSKRPPITHYHEVCDRADHLTTCRIGGHNYVVYVQDRVS